MSPEPNEERKRDFNRIFDAMREKRDKGSKCVNELLVHRWMWQELKDVVDEGLVNLIYTPQPIGRPAIYGMSSGDVFLDFNANRPQDGGRLYPGDDLGAEDLPGQLDRRIKYRVPEDLTEGFYEMMENNALPRDIVAFLGEENLMRY